jgi:hypothetical protein
VPRPETVEHGVLQIGRIIFTQYIPESLYWGDARFAIWQGIMFRKE